MERPDITLKDEGDFVTVILNSDRALELAKKDESIAPFLYHERKWDLHTEYQSSLASWAENHKLTVDEF